MSTPNSVDCAWQCAGHTAGQRHPRRRRTGASNGRGGRQSTAVDRRAGPSGQSVRATRTAGRGRHLSERNGRARPRTSCPVPTCTSGRISTSSTSAPATDPSPSSPQPSSNRRPSVDPNGGSPIACSRSWAAESLLDADDPDPWGKWPTCSARVPASTSRASASPTRWWCSIRRCPDRSTTSRSKPRTAASTVPAGLRRGDQPLRRPLLGCRGRRFERRLAPDPQA